MLVYKYRGITNNLCKSNHEDIFERDLKALERNQFWASNLKDLNDPCEAITNTKKIKKILNFIGKKVGVESPDDFQMINDNTDDVLSLDDKMGIYSLSKTYLDELLWAHYSNSHKGFCIEYSLETLLKNDGSNHIHSHPVKYSITPPSIGYMDIIINRKNEMIQKFAFYKSKRWNYEKEHRVVTSKIGLNSYDFKALKGIYFGLKMDDSKKIEIMNRLKGRGVKYYQIVLKKNSYKFMAKNIDDINDDKLTYLNEIEISTSKNETIKFKITKSKIFNYAGIGEIDVFLKEKLNENQLSTLANHLKRNILSEAKTIFINHYLEPVYRNSLPYASTNYQKGKFQIQIIGNH